MGRESNSHDDGLVMSDRVSAARFWALRFVEEGFAVIPLTKGSKRPRGERWQNRRMTADEVRREVTSGYGVRGGADSGNLVILDIEDGATAQALCPLIEHILGQRLRTTPIVRTPSGGIHIYVRSGERTGGSIRLAHYADDDPRCERDVTGKRRRTVRIETRAEGGQVVGPGTEGSHHPSGKAWQLVAGDPGSCAVVTQRELESIFAACRTFEEWIGAAEPEQSVRREPRRVRNPGGLRPGDDFNSRVSWAEILEPHGWRIVRMRAGVGYWKRPGDNTSGALWSATTNHAGLDLLHVFSTNAAPFQPGVSISKFHAFAQLEYGGDHAAAARALAANGFGPPKREPNARCDGESARRHIEDLAALRAPLDCVTVLATAAAAIRTDRADLARSLALVISDRLHEVGAGAEREQLVDTMNDLDRYYVHFGLPTWIPPSSGAARQQRSNDA